MEQELRSKSGKVVGQIVYDDDGNVSVLVPDGAPVVISSCQDGVMVCFGGA